MNVGTFFIAHTKSPELVQPGKGALDDPARGSKAATVFGVAFGDDGLDVFGTQNFSMGLRIVAAVGLKAIGAMAGSSALAAHRGHRFHQWKELSHVVGVCARQREAKRDALRVREDVVFAPGFSPIRWIRPRFLPPKRARTDALSATARDQSSTSALFKCASNRSCMFCQMPACCQACRRRQQVIPLPQPISWGRYSQGIPVRKTNRMPVRACRLGTAGRPLLLGGLSGGRRGAIRSQSLSGKIGRAMPRLLRSPLGFG